MSVPAADELPGADPVSAAVAVSVPAVTWADTAVPGQRTSAASAPAAPLRPAAEPVMGVVPAVVSVPAALEVTGAVPASADTEASDPGCG